MMCQMPLELTGPDPIIYGLDKGESRMTQIINSSPNGEEG